MTVRLGARLPLPDGWSDAAGEAILGSEATLSAMWGEVTGTEENRRQLDAAAADGAIRIMWP